MIDWLKVAESNNMTIADFEKELFSAAAVLGAMRLDSGESNGIVFCCLGDIGKIKMTITRCKTK